MQTWLAKLRKPNFNCLEIKRVQYMFLQMNTKYVPSIVKATPIMNKTGPGHIYRSLQIQAFVFYFLGSFELHSKENSVT
jgi:hypothetical protein